MKTPLEIYHEVLNEKLSPESFETFMTEVLSRYGNQFQKRIQELEEENAALLSHIRNT